MTFSGGGAAFLRRQPDKILKISSAFLAWVLLLDSMTYASQSTAQNLVANQYSVEARVFFRPWNTKGFGAQTGTESLTVIASPEEQGDIVILRKNNASAGFTAEVYRPDADVDKPDIWNQIAPEGEKSIVRQPDNSFHLSELVGGKEGGRRIEIFKLDGPTQ